MFNKKKSLPKKTINGPSIQDTAKDSIEEFNRNLEKSDYTREIKRCLLFMNVTFFVSFLALAAFVFATIKGCLA